MTERLQRRRKKVAVSSIMTERLQRRRKMMNFIVLFCVVLLLLLRVPDLSTKMRKNEALTYLTDVIYYATTNNESISSPTLMIDSDEDDNLNLPTLDELVQLMIVNSTQYFNYPCPNNTMPFPDTPLSQSQSQSSPQKKIPQIVHITSKTRCVPVYVFRHLQRWQLEGHALYFHDDTAVHKLMKYAIQDNNGTGLVPNLEKILSCVTAGATLADIWRYTLLWYYGGIYTDIDNSPVKFNGETIQATDDAFFTVEQLGIMSQYFFASSSHHPLLLEILNQAMLKLAVITNVMVNVPHQNTGPGAVKMGFIVFQNNVGSITNGYIPAGIYEGALDEHGSLITERALDNKSLYFMNNATDISSRNTTNKQERRYVTVVGHKGKSKQYVNRGGLGARKKTYFAGADMPYYHDTAKIMRGARNKISCQQHIVSEEQRMQQLNISTSHATTGVVYPRYQKANYLP